MTKRKQKLRPEDRGTPKDPSYGIHDKRFEAARERDPKGVAKWLKRIRSEVHSGERFYRR